MSFQQQYMQSELCRSSNSLDPCTVLNATASANNSITAYYVFGFGKFLHGVGASMLIATGFVYVAENGKDGTISLLLGKLNGNEY
jgi:Organic Anion Transporter Polypeptide (OATP) family